eukprot:scaffold17.g456.t1
MGLIKELRERTGAPISEVKTALAASNWDPEEASKELRKKGLSAASKKASRHAAEGLIGVAKGPGAAAVVEINSETDFVSRNDQFQALVGSAAAAALQVTATRPGSHELELEALQAARMPQGASSLGDAVVAVAGSVRENVRLRRGFRLAAGPGGAVGTYVHAAVGGGLGRIAGLVALESEPPAAGEAAAAVEDLARKLAMQVVGAAPRYLDRRSVPDDDLAAECALLREQAAKSGKPPAIVDKMVEGRLGKFYGEHCLLEQSFIMDGSQTVQQVLADVGKEAGSKLSVSGFVRVQVGEGLEQEAKKDFAAEVAHTIQETSSA